MPLPDELRRKLTGGTFLCFGIAATAHGLRHRFGTKLYEATNDPFLVAQVMGHASTDTTRGYCRSWRRRLYPPSRRFLISSRNRT